MFQQGSIGGGLWRQGSMNLPAPEDSGVPPDNPDFCILRIRRNHLIEVCETPFRHSNADTPNEDAHRCP